MTVKLKDNVYWVGAVDWALRDFHGYITGRGATYNSYLIVDEKVTLVDTVKSPFYPEMLERIRRIIDPAKIQYLICNHIEKDHSSAMPELIRQFPNIKIFATKMAQTGLKKYYGDLPVATVATGDTLKLGKKTIQFIEVPMIHWPDSMFSYIPEDRLLLSNDGFGQHIATSGRFDDEVSESEVMYEAAKYYANLLTHLAPLIQNTLRKVSELKLDIDMIAPSHGIIWRSSPGKIIQAYSDWCQHKAKEKIVVIYDTMWQATEKMAKIILETVTDAGIEAKLLKLRENHRSDVMTDILDSRGFFLGSPTIHRNLFPSVADLLCYMKGLKPQNKTVAAFGSYGWSGESMQLAADGLKDIGLDVIEPGVRAQYLPDDAEQAELVALARQVIAKVKNQ
jgi:flavorubredoxin